MYWVFAFWMSLSLKQLEKRMRKLVLPVMVLTLLIVGDCYAQSTITVTEETILLRDPIESSPPIMKVFPGSTLIIVHNENGWLKLKTIGGDVGFAPKMWFTSSELGEVTEASESNGLELDRPRPKGDPKQLQTGLHRQVVTKMLGPATWATIPTDTGELKLPDRRIGLILYWRNTPCTPVKAQFNNDYKLVGWDEGRSYCKEDAYLAEPPAEYSCGKSDRSKLCQ